MTRTASLLILLLSLCAAPLSTHASAQEATPETVTATLSRLSAAYDRVESVSADFTQTSRFAGFNTVKTFGGHLDLVRPDRMRWDYRDGSSQQIYLKDRQVTVYAPSGKQAIVSTLTPASDRQIPLHLLADVSGLADTYLVAAGDAPNALILTPKAPASGGPTQIHLWLDNDTGLIGRVRLSLPGGGSSEIAFSDFTTNLPINAERFLFEAPKGVYVVHPKAIFPGGGH